MTRNNVRKNGRTPTLPFETETDLVVKDTASQVVSPTVAAKVEEVIEEAPTPVVAETPASDPTPILPTGSAEEEVLTEPDPVAPSLFDRVKSIVSVPKGKNAVPTLVSFTGPQNSAKRYVIVDVNNHLLEEAWQVFRAERSDDEAEQFLAMVYEALKLPVPRMYRNVAPLDL